MIHYGVNVKAIPGSTYMVWLADYAAPIGHPPGWAGRQGYNGNMNPIAGSVIQSGPHHTDDQIISLNKSHPHIVHPSSITKLGLVVMVYRDDGKSIPGQILPGNHATGTLIPGTSFYLHAIEIL